MTTTPASEIVAGSVCPQCGEPVAEGDLFCEACGQELPAPPAGSETDGVAGADGVEGGGGAGAEGAAAGPAGPCVSCGAEDQIAGDGYCGVCGMKQPDPHDHEELVVDGAAAVTDRGRQHPRNEDAVAVARRDDGRLVAVVCDGVSSTVDADRAAAAGTTAALGTLLAADLGDPDAAPEALMAAYVAARAAVHALPFSPAGDLGPPSCTFLAAIVTPPGIVDLAGLGDCRAYWLDAATGAETMLTADDSWAADQVADRAMSAADAYADPRAHAITRWIALDAEPAWRPEPSRVELGEGRLLLCSDGLWNYATTPGRLTAAARGDDTGLLATARRLVQFANDEGGHDNVTVVAVDLPLPAPDT